MHLPQGELEGEEGRGEGSLSLYFISCRIEGSTVPSLQAALAQNQMYLKWEFLLRILVCLRVQPLTVSPRRAGWGLQGITKDAKDAASSSTCSTEHIRSQGQAPTSFGSPLLPSQDDTRIQLRRNSGIKLKVSGKAEKS